MSINDKFKPNATEIYHVTMINNGNVSNIYDPTFIGTANLKAKANNYPNNNRNKFEYIDYLPQKNKYKNYVY